MIICDIFKSLTPLPDNNLRLGFSIWARNPPKNYLSSYPKAAEEARIISGANKVYLCALVDDVWPMIFLSRNPKEQEVITSLFVNQLLGFGFHETYLVSSFIKNTCLEDIILLANKFTVSEFWKLLPQEKRINSCNKLTLSEALAFLWHTHVLKFSFEEFQLSGFLAGIRSKFFYLAARKLLPEHSVYFINTL